jgi:hypothetical protein
LNTAIPTTTKKFFFQPLPLCSHLLPHHLPRPSPPEQKRFHQAHLLLLLL